MRATMGEIVGGAFLGAWVGLLLAVLLLPVAVFSLDLWTTVAQILVGAGAVAGALIRFWNRS